MEFWADGGFEEGSAVFGGEDDVDEDEREGLWHGLVSALDGIAWGLLRM